MRRWIVLVSACVALAFATIARADEFRLPGLDADASAYTATLQQRFPAGGTPKGRTAAEQQAAAAIARHDLAAAAAALEQRLGMGEATSQQWRDLATAALHRAPPDARKASLAAWRAFTTADDAPGEISALLVLAEALRARGQDAPAVQALEQVVQRAPDDAGYARLLADAQRAAGMQVSKVDVEGEADPPRACIRFTAPPSRRADFVPQDWVRLDPPVAGAAVTREGDALCVSGLPSGATTTAILRAGLPAEPRDAGAALALAHDAPVALVDSGPGGERAVRHAAVRAAARAGAGGDAHHHQPVQRVAVADAAVRARRGAVPPLQPARRPGGRLRRAQHRRAVRPRGLEGQGGDPRLETQCPSADRAAVAAAAADRGAGPVRPDRQPRRRHARRQRRLGGADGGAHRPGPDRLARRGRADGAGARLLRREGAAGHAAAAAGPQQRHPGRGGDRRGWRGPLRRTAAARRGLARAGRHRRRRAG